MKIVRNTIKTFVLLANLMVGLCFLFSAYSPAISPASHPVLACAGMLMPVFILLNMCFIVFWCFASIKMVVFPISFFLIGWGPLMDYAPINLSSAGHEGDALKILTYNVMQMQQREGREAMIEYIKKSDADIVCLQEFPFNNRRIRNRLQESYPYIKVCSFNSRNSVACLSKHPVKLIREIKTGSAFNGSALFRVRYKETDIPVIVNHLESNKLTARDKALYREILKSPDKEHVNTDGKYLLRKLADAMSIRSRQADIVAEQIEKESSPYTIVCGDFNDTPVSYVHNKISETLKDAFIEAGNGPGITYNRSLLFFRIDHIMAADAYTVTKCEVDNSIKASDHYPLYCVLGINKH